MSNSTLASSRGDRFEVCLQSYGAKVLLESNSSDLLETAKASAARALVNNVEFIENPDVSNSQFVRRISFDVSDEGYRYRENGNEIEFGSSLADLVRVVDTMVRVSIAEYAVGSVFLHAGVVSWRGQAIVVPGSSSSGKTTLTAELVRAGAEYFSDEYAVLDHEGLVHPFPRDLSFRGGGRKGDNDVPPENFGAVGSGPVPVGLVLLTKYDADARWAPEVLTVGRGIIEVISHTLPIRANTEFSLKVLNNALRRAIIVKSPRGEAVEFARDILNFIDDLGS